MLRGSTTIERAIAFVAMIEGRFATRKYHAPAAITTSRAVITKASGAECFFGSGGLTSDADFTFDADMAAGADFAIEPPLYLAVGVGQTDRARHGDALQSRGDVDAVAH